MNIFMEFISINTNVKRLEDHFEIWSCKQLQNISSMKQFFKTNHMNL